MKLVKGKNVRKRNSYKSQNYRCYAAKKVNVIVKIVCIVKNVIRKVRTFFNIVKNCIISIDLVSVSNFVRQTVVKICMENIDLVSVSKFVVKIVYKSVIEFARLTLFKIFIKRIFFPDKIFYSASLNEFFLNNFKRPLRDTRQKEIRRPLCERPIREQKMAENDLFTAPVQKEPEADSENQRLMGEIKRYGKVKSCFVIKKTLQQENFTKYLKFGNFLKYSKFEKLGNRQTAAKWRRISRHFRRPKQGSVTSRFSAKCEKAGVNRERKQNW